MGLDQNLVKTYLVNNEWKANKHFGTWRNCSQIHKWIYDNVDKDIGYSMNSKKISLDDLFRLRDACENVLNSNTWKEIPYSKSFYFFEEKDENWTSYSYTDDYPPNRLLDSYKRGLVRTLDILNDLEYYIGKNDVEFYYYGSA